MLNSTSSVFSATTELPLHFTDINFSFALTLMTCLGVAGVVGTFGNLLILVSVAKQRELRNVESVFIVNLACCDLYVTMFAEPLSIVTKVVGWKYFDAVPIFCRIVGSLCTISCLGSLMTLAAMSCSRYLYICHQPLHRKIFTLRHTLLVCLAFFLLGFLLVSLNFVGIGDHSFDRKSYECVWDRTKSRDYTVVVSVLYVWGPIIVAGMAYGRTFLYVKRVRSKVHVHLNTFAPANRIGGLDQSDSASNDLNAGEGRSFQSSNGSGLQTAAASRGHGDECTDPGKQEAKNAAGLEINVLHFLGSLGSEAAAAVAKHRSHLKLARTLFIIYVVFTTCWIPYSLVLVMDTKNTYGHELHAFTRAFAHLNSSINWLVYYYTHTKLRRAFRCLLHLENFAVT